jgi:hypothetical protein
MVQTYRKFDRFRSRTAFATFIDNFETLVANRWVPSGVGTPGAQALGADGGLQLVTSAANGDSNIVQRGIESAATKTATLKLQRGRKVSAVARVEHADFANMDIMFGVAPALADPFAGNASAFVSLGATLNQIKVGAEAFTPDVAVTLAALRDKLGGIDFEFYWDGQSKIALFAGGQRVGGKRGLATFDVNGYVGAFTAPLSISVGVRSRSASAKTVVVRQLGYTYQIKPDLNVPTGA